MRVCCGLLCTALLLVLLPSLGCAKSFRGPDGKLYDGRGILIPPAVKKKKHVKHTKVILAATPATVPVPVPEPVPVPVPVPLAEAPAIAEPGNALEEEDLEPPPPPPLPLPVEIPPSLPPFPSPSPSPSSAMEGESPSPNPSTEAEKKKSGVSVCVPCIPRDLSVLRRGLLPSIAKQTLTPDEVVVALSDTTPTASYQLQDAFRREFPSLNIRFVPCAETMPPGLNRNRAAAAARGKIVSFFDADDLMHPQRLEIVKDVMENTGAVCVVHSFSTHEEIFQEHFEWMHKVSPLHFGGGRLERVTELAERAHHFISAAEEKKEAWPLEHHGHVSCTHEVTDKIKYDSGYQAEDTHFTREAKERFNQTMFVALPLSVYRPSWTFPEVRIAVGAYSEVEDLMKKLGMTSE